MEKVIHSEQLLIFRLFDFTGAYLITRLADFDCPRRGVVTRSAI
jgi:hypothetical protein